MTGVLHGFRSRITVRDKLRNDKGWIDIYIQNCFGLARGGLLAKTKGNDDREDDREVDKKRNIMYSINQE